MFIHRIAHIDFDEEDDEAVENKTKQKRISLVINILTMIFGCVLCRSTSPKFSRQQNFVAQSKLPESRISARAILCHFADLNISCLYKFDFSFLCFK